MRCAILLCGLLVFLPRVLVGSTPPLPEAESGQVEVDFAVPVSPVPMGGLLEGIKEREPGDAQILPIRVGGEFARHFAYGPYRAAALRSRELGYRLIIRLDRYEMLHGKWPYEDWPLWEKYVGEQARFWGREVIYDVWNEPDQAMFWKGTARQYHQTYIHAYRALAKVLGPGVQVSGPSSAIYRPELIRNFLDDCQAGGVRVPVLNWHELVDTRPDEVKAHLETQRRLAGQPGRAGLGIKRITINETFPTENAGATLALFSALEAGRADGACNSCFNNDCEKGSLSGLLEPGGDHRPRSSWFVYEAYASGVRQRVQSTGTNPRLAGLGSKGLRGQPGTAQVLLGYDGTDTGPERAEVTLHLKHLDQIPGLKPGPVKISVYRLANSGNRASQGFVLESSRQARVKDGGMVLKIALGRQEVYRVEMAGVP